MNPEIVGLDEGNKVMLGQIWLSQVKLGQVRLGKRLGQNPTCVSQHVNPEIVWLDEGGAALGAEVILGHLDTDMSVEDVRVELACKRESRSVITYLT